MDWNGDGYPDIWYADNLVLSNMTGGLNNPSGDHNFGVLNSSAQQTNRERTQLVEILQSLKS